MIKTFTIILFILPLIVSGQKIDNTYNRIIHHFADNYLDSSLYRNECSGLNYSNISQVFINHDSTLWTPLLFTIDNYFNTKIVENDVQNIDSTTRKTLLNPPTISDIKIDFRGLINFKPTSTIIAPEEVINNFVLLRLSAPLLWNNYLYIELWIKRDYHSSGTRIIYQINLLGEIVRSKKYNMCDDWG